MYCNTVIFLVPSFCSVSFNTLSHIIIILHYPLLSKMVTSCHTCIPCFRQQRIYTATLNTQYNNYYIKSPTFCASLMISILSQPEVELHACPEDPHTHQHTFIPYCHTSLPLHPQVVVMFHFHNSQQIFDHSHKCLLLSVV